MDQDSLAHQAQLVARRVLPRLRGMLSMLWDQSLMRPELLTMSMQVIPEPHRWRMVVRLPYPNMILLASR